MGENVKVGGKCDEDEMKNHVKTHLNKEMSDTPPIQITSEIPECIKITSKHVFQDDDIDAGAPTKSEFMDALLNLKNKKSSTDIRGECLKVAIQSDDFFEALYAHIIKIWDEKSIPESWRYSRITCIFKSGDRCLPANYRTLSVSAVMLKAVMSIVLLRSRKWYELTLSDAQNGFRAARGTADSVFIVKNLIRIAKSRKTSIYALALDLRAAYDWINRSWLWLVIAARNKDSEHEQELHDLFELVRVLYSRTYSYMAGETPADAFETSCGLLQGAVESPPLFGLFCDTIMRLFEDKMKSLGVGGIKFRYFIPASASTRAQRVMDKLEGETMCYYTAYCDDIFLLAETSEELQIMTTELEKLFGDFGLTISTKKTKTLILNYTDPPENYPKSFITINNIKIENVKTFKYLGVKINYQETDTGKTEIKYRISTANFKFRELKHVFENHKIKLSTRIKFYNAYVRSRLTYLCGLWSVSTKLKNEVRKTHVRHLRSMVSGGWKRRGGARSLQDEIGYNFKPVYSNARIYEITKTEPVLEFIDSQRAKWIAHTVRCDNDRIVKRSMFEETQKSRKGRTVSILDQFLKQTRSHDCIDSEVYKASISRELFSLLDDRGLLFASKQNKIE